MGTPGFLLLGPGPLEKDELRGDVDLIEAHNLTNIVNHIISGRLQPQDYVRGVAGMAEFRKGPGLELAPVAEMLPASVRPDVRPLRPDELQRGFMLQPGRYQLSEVDKGIPVASALSQAGPTSTATGAASAETTAKEKRKKEKKEKKRRREETREPASQGS